MPAVTMLSCIKVMHRTAAAASANVIVPTHTLNSCAKNSNLAAGCCIVGEVHSAKKAAGPCRRESAVVKAANGLDSAWNHLQHTEMFKSTP